jgi:hypothetical protein
MFSVPCCDIRYDFCIKIMLASYLTPICLEDSTMIIYVICIYLHIVLANITWPWETWRVSYKRQELLILREHMGSSILFWLGPCCTSFEFLHCVCVLLFAVVMYLVCSILSVSLGFSIPSYHFHLFLKLQSIICF